MSSTVVIKVQKAKNLKQTLTGRPQPWHFIITSADNNRRLARSTERYTNRQDCVAAARLVGSSQTNAVLRVPGFQDQLLRQATPTE